MKKDELLKKLNNCKVKDEDKIKELVKEYLENGYPIKEILLNNIPLNSVVKSVIKYDEILCLLLGNYYVYELAPLAKSDNIDLLKKYIECLYDRRDYVRMYDVIYEYKVFVLEEKYYDKFSMEHLYNLYAKYEHWYKNILVEKISNVFSFKSSDDLLELNEILNNKRENGPLKSTLLIKLYEKLSVEEAIKKFDYADIKWYVNFIISNNDIKRAYEFYKLTNDDEIKLRLFELIKEKDTGKYIYLLLTQNKLSKKQKEQLEEKLENCTDKQYKYFYLFYLNKKEIINIFVSYSAFMLFISTFSDKEEIQKIKVALEDALAQESENFEDSLSIVKTPVNNNVKRMK